MSPFDQSRNHVEIINWKEKILSLLRKALDKEKYDLDRRKQYGYCTIYKVTLGNA